MPLKYYLCLSLRNGPMRILTFSILLFVSTLSLSGQKTIEGILKAFNEESVPYIYVEEITNLAHYVLLDTRAPEEFAVSHLKGASWVGYAHFEASAVLKKVAEKDAPIVVYCSIGARSEEIGEKLVALGYTNVKNLYGGIFEWKNKGNAVFDPQGEETKKVHAFDKEWGKLLKKGKKVYSSEQ